MKPLGFRLLTDENIHPGVVAELRKTGKNIRTVLEEGLGGADDASILRRAEEQGRVVLAHDSDFGTLAVHAGQPYVGMVYLRPGHISSAFVLEMIAAVESTTESVEPPFIAVAERRSNVVRIRIRRSTS